MEKLNEHFIAQHHGVNPDKIDLLADNGEVILGSNEDYLAMIEFVNTHDLSIQDNYDYVASQIDIDNYIDWCAIEIYVAMEDLNVKYWRPQTPGGKWRWILYDMDWGFWHLHQIEYAERLDFFSFFLDPEGTGNNHRDDNDLIRGLLANEGFKQKFIERFVYHCTVTFEPFKVQRRIDELAANIEPYMERSMVKWTGAGGSTMEIWGEQSSRTIARFRGGPSRHQSALHAAVRSASPTPRWSSYYRRQAMNDQTRVLRHELKYMLNERDYHWLRNRIAALMPLDIHADPRSRGYHIRSLYYDDAYDSALFEKVDGDPTRQKYRIRIYQLSDSYILLEKKAKAAYCTVKDSARISRGQCDRILAGDYGVLYESPSPLLREFYGTITSRQLRPKVLVDYFPRGLYVSGGERPGYV